MKPKHTDPFLNEIWRVKDGIAQELSTLDNYVQHLRASEPAVAGLHERRIATGVVTTRRKPIARRVQKEFA